MQPVRTADRILGAAMDAFGTRGYDGTSLDDLARELGHPQADDPLLVPVQGGAARGGGRPLRRRGDAAVSCAASSRPSDGFGRVEAMVRAMFRLAARHPSMLGFLREVTRLGPPASTRLLDHLSPLIDRASAFLEAEMDAGRMRRHDPRLLLLAAYSMVTGMATEVEVLRAFGEEPTLPSLVHRRDELLSLLRAALEPVCAAALLRPSLRSPAASASASRRRGEASRLRRASDREVHAGHQPRLHRGHPHLLEAGGVVEVTRVLVGADLDARDRRPSGGDDDGADHPDGETGSRWSGSTNSASSSTWVVATDTVANPTTMSSSVAAIVRPSCTARSSRSNISGWAQRNGRSPSLDSEARRYTARSATMSSTFARRTPASPTSG